MRLHPKIFWCALLIVVFSTVPSVRAIVSGSTTNTSDPGSSAWDYVGAIGGASGVYLGDYNGTYWVLTAAHVGLGDFTLGGTTYSAVTGSAINIYNTDNSQADLTLFQISASPGLANLSLNSFSNLGPATVQMIGFGGGKSWGTNTVAGYTDYMIGGTAFGGHGIVTLASGESGNGGQGVGGDSGGGEFYYNGSTWVLAGILSGVGELFSGGMSLGQGTIAVDLALYRTQILNDINAVSAIPEPASWAMAFGVVTLALTVWRRRRIG